MRPPPRSGAPGVELGERPAADELLVSVVCLHGLFNALRQRGISPEDLLRGEGLEPIAVGDARSFVTVRAYERVVDAALHRTRTPSLGLDSASEPGNGLYQLLAHFALAVPTLRDALGMLVRYHQLFVDGGRFALAENGGVAYFRFSLHNGFASSALRFASESFAALCVRVVRDVYAPEARPYELRFRHPSPDYHARYGEVFGCPVRFSESECSIAFPAALLDKPQPCADAFVADLLREACERMLVSSAPRASVASRVRLLLRRQTDLCRVDQDALARELGMGRRMLRRRLLREGANMSALIDEARMESARVELLRSGGTIKEAAERLGYSEISAFHRAFKRWTGKTPAEYVRAERKKHDDS